MTDGKTIAGRPAHTLVQVAPNLDLGRLSLSREEGLVVSRVGNGLSLGQLASGLALPAQQVDVVLNRLITRGVLVAASARPGSTGAGDAPDLPPERRKEIAELEERSQHGTPFEMLGVPNGAPADACKRAYYDLSMRLHPDRFYGKNLGTWKSRIDHLFRKLTEAQSVLTDADKRAAYQRAHPELFRSEAAESETHDEVRAEDRAKRIARHPYLAKVARQKELLARARSSLASGQAAAAALDLEQLLKLDPANADAKKLMHEANVKREAQKGGQAYEEAVKLSAMGDHAGAVRLFLQALEKAPSKELCIKALPVARDAGDLKSAKSFAQKWVEFEPRSARARLALAEILEQAGMKKNAKREAEEALKLDPDNKVAKAIVARLRWA